MDEISTIGLDIAKNVFQVHGVDDAGRVVVRRQLRRRRQLPVIGAMAVIKRAKLLGYTRYPWLVKLMARRSVKVAAIAPANKNARTVWAMMARDETYRAPKLAAV